MPSCTITPDPDIAGIGVRLAVYVQAVLLLLPFAYMPTGSERYMGNQPLVQYLSSRSRSSIVVLSLTTGALLIVSFIKHSSGSLSPYHALVVLNLSWIVAVSTISSVNLNFAMQGAGEPGSYARMTQAEIQRAIAEGDLRRVLRLSAGLTRAQLMAGNQLLHSAVISLHVLMISILGCLLFRDVQGFARGGECPAETVLWMFGKWVHITDPAPRRALFAVYILTALLPLFSTALFVLIVCPMGILVFCYCALFRGRLPPFILVLKLAGIFPLAVLALFIVSTEKTIAGNSAGEDEREWGFGQILAMMLVAFPCYEALALIRLVFVLRRETVRSCFAWPIFLRGVEFANRVFIRPETACKYTSRGGLAEDGHLKACGNASAIILEAMAVSPTVSESDPGVGLWSDLHVAALQRVVATAHAQGLKIGAQLVYPARKPRSLLHPLSSLLSSDARALEEACSHRDDSAEPEEEMLDCVIELSENGIQNVLADFDAAVQRSTVVGFDFIEIQAADGLLHAFYSPLSNTRTDQYGGSDGNRARLTLDVVARARAAWDKPLFVRIAARSEAAREEDGPREIARHAAFAWHLSAFRTDRPISWNECRGDGVGGSQWTFGLKHLSYPILSGRSVDLVNVSFGDAWLLPEFGDDEYERACLGAIRWHVPPTVAVGIVGVVEEPVQAARWLAQGMANVLILTAGNLRGLQLPAPKGAGDPLRPGFFQQLRRVLRRFLRSTPQSPERTTMPQRDVIP